MINSNEALSMLPRLSKEQKRLILRHLHIELLLDSSVDTTMFSRYREDCKIECPHCKSDLVKKNGSIDGKQRFKCNTCNKTFGILSNTCIHALKKKHLWMAFIELTLNSNSIRKIAKKLNLSIQTVFDWRHKLLAAIDNVFTKDFHGVVEIDDIYMRLNQKGCRENFIEALRRTKTITNRYGSKVSMRIKGNKKRGISNNQVSILLTTDRYGTIGTGMLKRGKMTSESLNRVLNNGLLSRLNTENTIVTDEAKAYVSVLQNHGFDHEHINAGDKKWTKGIYHLNCLNNADGQFKKWITYHFSSVATKYLNNYLNYFKMLFFVLKDSAEMIEYTLRLSLKDINSINRFRNIENQYQEFLKY